MSEGEVAIAEAAARLWNARDREGFLDLFDSEAVWSSAIKRQVEGGKGLYEGREALGEFWDEWHSIWSDLNIVFSEVECPRDGWVFAFGSLRASGSGSGVHTEQPFGWVFQIGNGLIQEVRAYLDRAEALKAAGLSR